ncbi:hypothetical protein [Gemmobacter sp. 24YEA27]|uniref:hypothetical protein n=1 Tax=Gemmobacter sp. 24YEA27 TaxID=3040672 RepID=UPI0024B3C771|nr:hypothetical protein [Gemmobacter sp. 24YEA27]
MLPKKGRKLPVWNGALVGRDAYARTMADLLRKEHGESHRAVKALMRQTHASERTVKHWLSGQHGPDSLYFLRLMVSSPVIRAYAQALIEGAVAKRLSHPEDRHTLASARAAYAEGEATGAGSHVRDGSDDPEHDPDRDPMNDPETPEINERQHWFLARVAEGGRSGANEIVSTWQVSLKTARRDIAALKLTGMIQYIGSRRKGRYLRVRRPGDS